MHIDKTPEHKAWTNIKQRCFNPKNHAWHRYGGRGISMFDEWSASFKKFVEHVGLRPTSKHSIDRIDNSLGYFPGNVRWTTRDIQNRNKDNNSNITAFGQTMCITDWAKEKNINLVTLLSRIKIGMTPEEAMSTPCDGTNGAVAQITREQLEIARVRSEAGEFKYKIAEDMGVPLYTMLSALRGEKTRFAKSSDAS